MTTNILESYLQKLNEKKKVIREGVENVILFAIMLILMAVMHLLVLFAASKVSPKYTEIIRKVTGESRWKVRILPIPLPNAMALAFGTSTLFVTSKLIKMLTERELIAVMLHEVKHLRTLDSLQSAGAGLAPTGIFGGVSFKVMRTNRKLSSVMAILAVISYFFSSTAVNVTLGRWNETKADKYTVKYGYGKDLASALQKLDEWTKKYLSRQKCGKICILNRKISRMLDAHPDTKLRIERVLEEDEKTQKTIESMDPKEIVKAILRLKKGVI